MKIEVKAKPKRLAVDPRMGQVDYRLGATNADTEPSGTVRLSSMPRRCPDRSADGLGQAVARSSAFPHHLREAEH